MVVVNSRYSSNPQRNRYNTDINSDYNDYSENYLIIVLIKVVIL